MSDAFVPLCRLEDIPDPGARGFDPTGAGRDEFFVVRRGAELRAYRNDCPHWPGTPMAWRRDGYLSADGGHIVCYAHGARFDIGDGKCLQGPCVGRSLKAIAITTRADGTVLIASKK